MKMGKWWVEALCQADGRQIGYAIRYGAKTIGKVPFERRDKRVTLGGFYVHKQRAYEDAYRIAYGLCAGGIRRARALGELERGRKQLEGGARPVAA